MEQYLAIKDKHPDSVLFFRLGDFYEMFFEDAKLASRLLGITLTARFKDEKQVPMAGVPYHSATTYINRLLKSGHKVAICEQTEAAEMAEGLVDRAVTRIITPGTLIDEGLLIDKEHNYLLALNIDSGVDKAGLAWVDISTGEFKAEDVSKEHLIDEVRRLNPVECLIAEYFDERLLEQLKTILKASFTSRPAWTFERNTAYKAVTGHLGVTNFKGFGCEDLTLGIGSAGAIIQYLIQTYPVEKSSALTHITKLERVLLKNNLYLDRATQVSLELTATMRDNRLEGSLLWVLDKTTTGMGGRLLRDWITSPLVDIEEIRRRQESIRIFVENLTLRKELQRHLKDICDIERLSGRLGSGRANARDLVGLKNALKQIGDVSHRLNGLNISLTDIALSTEPLEPLRKLVNAAIIDNPPLELTEGGIIKAGYNEELDRVRQLSSEGKDWIARFQSDEIARTGINSLKVGYNQVFGYYIEVTNVHKEKIPPNYVRKQTLKNAERYITPELKDYETQVLNATSKAHQLEYEIFGNIRKEAAKHIGPLQQLARSVATLDVLLALAQAAVENNYCRPEVNNELIIRITDGRHPVLDYTMMEKFVPNDTLLDRETNRILVITGPNMAGKSTYIRQAALITLMAQMGSYIPAKEAVIGIVDRIFTRVGAADELFAGSSTFMVEMNETANILNNATPRSLIILDEIGRGTSTFDGLAISWAVTEYIYNKLASRTLFATHYHELTELSRFLPAVKNYHIAVKEWGDKIIFVRKIVAGGTDKSYGIHVARLAGIPDEVISRSKTILSNLEATREMKPGGKQLSIFT